jgi:hypothetical protein
VRTFSVTELVMIASATHRNGKWAANVLFGGVAAALFISSLGLAEASPARADGPGKGSPWVVTLGDSYISGEAGRWAGNTKTKPSEVDALGHTAYYDDPRDRWELIPGCHRSKSAEAYIGGGVSGLNLACSGAKTYTVGSGKNFKPGLDFYKRGGQEGQALMLEKFAQTHNVKLVPISIGGNNFNFKSIVITCVLDFLNRLRLFPRYCNKSKTVTDQFTKANIIAQGIAIELGILNVASAMTKAGYRSTKYTILIQNYPSPIPEGASFRYSQKGFTRQAKGGCGFWNQDADTVNGMMLPMIDKAVFGAAADTRLTNLKEMDISSAFDGHRLCEQGVGLLEEEGLTSWSQPEAVNKSEWVEQVRTVTTLLPTYESQEDLHPNYWGQLALRNCVRQAYNGGTSRGGTCTISGDGLNSAGEPNMTLR